jgi:hypothetical protein
MDIFFKTNIKFLLYKNGLQSPESKMEPGNIILQQNINFELLLFLLFVP